MNIPSFCAVIGLKLSPRVQYGQRITSLVSCAGMAGDGKRSTETFARYTSRVAHSRPRQSRAPALPREWLVRGRGWHSRATCSITLPSPPKPLSNRARNSLADNAGFRGFSPAKNRCFSAVRPRCLRLATVRTITKRLASLRGGSWHRLILLAGAG